MITGDGIIFKEFLALNYFFNLLLIVIAAIDIIYIAANVIVIKVIIIKIIKFINTIYWFIKKQIFKVMNILFNLFLPYYYYSFN